MVNDLFKKRMGLYGSCLGDKQRMDANLTEIATFRNDVNYRCGMIYDWDLQPIEMIDFKFEKVNTYSYEKKAVEYMVRFRPDFHPEFDYKDRHFRKDGKERLGFYLDVYDYTKNKFDKWLIVGKDDRVLFDRYLALKCNWFFEWIQDGKYRRTLGVIRDAADSTFNSTNSDTIGGTVISGSTSFVLPYNIDTSKINVGKTFVISDNIELPQVFKVNQIKDAINPGVIRFYAKEALFNKHRDYVGTVNDTEINFRFETPIPDLPAEFGGSLHMLCDALYEAIPEDPMLPADEIELITEAKGSLYVMGSAVEIECNVPVSQWVICVDDEEYDPEDLIEYFIISEDEKSFTIQAINKVMVNYIVTISAIDSYGNRSEEVRLVVKA